MIAIGVSVLVVVGVIMGLCFANASEAKLQNWPRFRAAIRAVVQFYQAGQVKLFILMLMCQVLSQFSGVVSSSGSGDYPEPAKSFVQRLGIANFDLLAVVPVDCMLPASTFYTKLVLKTVGPIGLIAVTWLYPLSHLAMRKPHEKATRDAAHVSLLFLELVLPTVSTTIAQTLVCERFSNGYFLRAQLTIPCNASPTRKLWIVYSVVMLVVFPLGRRCLFLYYKYNNGLY